MAAMQNNQARAGSLVGEMLSLSLYKWNQGRVTRQVTFAALAVIVGIGALQLARVVTGLSAGGEAGGPDLGVARFLVPGGLLAAGLWLCFRIVNIPKFAEFQLPDSACRANAKSLKDAKKNRERGTMSRIQQLRHLNL